MAYYVNHQLNKVQLLLDEAMRDLEDGCVEESLKLASKYDNKYITDEDRFLIMINHFIRCDLDLPFDCQFKNSNLSLDFKKQANKIFQTSKNDVDKLMEAYELYCKCIAASPNGSQELAFGYGNRSSLLWLLKRYDESLQDINRALKLYPDHLKPKLLKNKIECLKFLENLDMDNECAALTSELQSLNISTDEKKQVINKIKQLKKEKRKSSKAPNKLLKQRGVPKLSNSNERFPCASSAIDVVYNKKFGRHIVATRDIKCGEILIVEESFCKIIDQEYSYTHCFHCLQFSWSLIPCEHCIYSMYCSEECKKDDWQKSHKFECKVFSHLYSLDMHKRAFLSLRSALYCIHQAGNLDSVIKEMKRLDAINDPMEQILLNNSKFCSTDYRSFLTSIKGTELRRPQDLISRAIEAAAVAYYLGTETEFFGKKFGPDLSEMRSNKQFVAFGGLLMRSEQLCDIAHFYADETKYSDPIPTGSTMQPFCSFLNHSCDSNTIPCVYKNYKIFGANRSIKKGSQIFDNYAAPFLMVPKAQRQLKFQENRFTCTCVACEENWPTMDKVPHIGQILKHNRPLKEKLEDAFSGLKYFFFKAFSDDIVDIMNDADAKTYDEVIDVIELFEKHLPSQPCFEYSSVIQMFVRLFCLKYGNFVERPKFG